MAAISFAGRLYEDPEFKDAGSTRLAILKIPDDEGFGDRKVTTWWRVQVWGKGAERIENAFNNKGMYKKGDNVSVRGAGFVRQYDKNDGTKGSSPEVNADDVKMIFAPRDGGSSYSSDDAPPF